MPQSNPIRDLRRSLFQKLLMICIALGLFYLGSRHIYSFMPSVSLTALVSGLFYTVTVARKQTVPSRNRIPKVKGFLPGNVDVLWRLVQGEKTEYSGDIFRQWSHTYGPTFDMHILWSHQIITSDPTNIKEIVATKFTSFDKSDRFREMLSRFLGKGIFTSDGEEWQRNRALTKPFFSRERISDFDLFERHVGRLVKHLDVHTTNPVNIQDLFCRFTIDTIADFLFGMHLSALDLLHSDSNDKLAEFVAAFEELGRISTRRIRIGSSWPLFELFGDTSDKPARIVDRFVLPIVHQAVANRTSSDTQPQIEQSYLEFLVQEVQDVRLIRDSLVSVMLAGRDTTASLLSFATYCLAIYPDVTRRLREEIKKVLGTEDRVPSEKHLKDMRYLRAILNETLRLFPPVPFNIRRANQDTSLSSPLSGRGPLMIKKGVSVTFAPLLLQRRVDVWGEDAEEFKPERWIPSGDGGREDTEDFYRHLKDLKHVSEPYASIPFNGGPRICLGQMFALNERSYVLVRLLQRFRGFELIESKQSLPPRRSQRASAGRQAVEKCWPRASLNLYIEGGLWVRPIQAEKML